MDSVPRILPHSFPPQRLPARNRQKKPHQQKKPHSLGMPKNYFVSDPRQDPSHFFTSFSRQKNKSPVRERGIALRVIIVFPLRHRQGQTAARSLETAPAEVPIGALPYCPLHLRPNAYPLSFSGAPPKRSRHRNPWATNQTRCLNELRN